MPLSKTQTQAIAVVVVVVIIVAAVAVYFVVSGDDEEDSYSDGAVTIETPVDYNGNTALQTFEQVPQRVVCGCCTAVNLMLYLGLGDLIVGIYYMEEDVWDEVADEYDKVVARIGSDHVLEGNIQVAVLTDWEPDCVIGWVAWTDSGLGSTSYWNALGCNVWSYTTMVDDGTLEGMQTDYDNMGNVFNVKSKTDAFMSALYEKMESLQGVFSTNAPTVAVYDGCYLGNTERFWFYGTNKFVGYVLDYIGVDLAFPEGGSRHDIAEVYDQCENFDVLFFVCYGSVNYDDTYAYWKSDPILSQTPAILNGNCLPIKLSVSYGADPSIMDLLDYLVELFS